MLIVLIMSLHAYFAQNFGDPLKKASSKFVNKKSQLARNNSANSFQLSWLFKLSKQTKMESLLFCLLHKLR